MANNIYILSACDARCGTSSQRIQGVTTDIIMLHAMLAAKIKTGEIGYGGFDGDSAWKAFQEDLTNEEVDLDQLTYGFVQIYQDMQISDPISLCEFEGIADSYAEITGEKAKAAIGTLELANKRLIFSMVEIRSDKGYMETYLPGVCDRTVLESNEQYKAFVKNLVQSEIDVSVRIYSVGNGRSRYPNEEELSVIAHYMDELDEKHDVYEIKSNFFSFHYEDKKMSDNAQEEHYEYIELFGKPALFSNLRVDRDTIPHGFYCYDLRGSDNDPGQPVTVEESVKVNHAATVITATQVSIPKSGRRYLGKDGLNFLGECLSLSDFYEKYSIKPLADKCKFALRPATSDETKMFYALSEEQDAEMGTVGHVRIDFGSNGTEFHHTWWPRGAEELNSPAFKAELERLVNELCETGPLKDRTTMRSYCYEHGGSIDARYGNNFGYIIETESYRYYLRCNPTKCDYNAYLTAFNRSILKLYESTLRITLPDGRQLCARIDTDINIPCIQPPVAPSKSEYTDMEDEPAYDPPF